MLAVKDQVKDKLLSTPFSTVVEPEPPATKETRLSFMKYAERDDETGEWYLEEAHFIDALAPGKEDYHKIKREQYGLLFRVADRRKTGRVSLADWANFENLLAKPDAEYEIAFRLFDARGTGTIKFPEFKKLYDLNKAEDALPFDWNSEWASLYTGGRNKRHEMNYPQFSQMLRGLQGERVRQAFQHFDKNGDGYIEPEEFQKIIIGTAAHKLSDHLLENLHTLCNISPTSKISYANVRAFQNILREMDLIDFIVRQAADKSPDKKITRTDFLNEAARITRFTLFTPMEADILFHFAGMDPDEGTGRLGLADFAKVLDASWQVPESLRLSSKSAPEEEPADGRVKRFMGEVVESAHHFALGSIAGAFGAFMVYPIDLVKTRMQNQRGGPRVGTLLYKNSIDCAIKVFRNEGIRGLYSGVMPQMVGVAPEKAIKLTVNDLVRKRLTDESGRIWWGSELVAGGAAGGCQVIFTNPLEIVKIRLQMEGELKNGGQKRGAIWIIKNLGLGGLYKGASACLARDVPFSAIYFPTYFHLKKDLFGEGPNKKLGIAPLLISGAIAGMPAAYLTTPMDVVKTRLQVEARKGEQTYTSLRHCARTILAQEGWRAFFKGGPARVLRSSPQFGFTLAGYEYLSRIFPLHHEDATSPEAGGKYLAPGEQAAASSPLSYVRSRNALKILLDLDTKFGMPKKEGGSRWVANYSFLNGHGNGNGHANGLVAGGESGGIGNGAGGPHGVATAAVSSTREGPIATQWYQKFGDLWWGGKKDN